MAVGEGCVLVPLELLLRGGLDLGLWLIGTSDLSPRDQ